MAGLLFAAYGRFEYAGSKAGILLCMSITRDEMEACQAGQTKQVFAALKSSGGVPILRPVPRVSAAAARKWCITSRCCGPARVASESAILPRRLARRVAGHRASSVMQQEVMFGGDRTSRPTSGGDPVPGIHRMVFVKNVNYFLTFMSVFKDGMIECWHHRLPLAEFADVVRSGWVTTQPAEGAVVHLDGIATFAVTNVQAVSGEDFLKDLADDIERLNNRPTSWMLAHEAWHQYQASPSEQAKDRLRELYEAVPPHRRRFAGEMDGGDIPIRILLYGEVFSEGLRCRRTACCITSRCCERPRVASGILLPLRSLARRVGRHRASSVMPQTTELAPPDGVIVRRAASGLSIELPRATLRHLPSSITGPMLVGGGTTLIGSC